MLVAVVACTCLEHLCDGAVDVVQVADRLIFHRGSKHAWRSAVLRVKGQALCQNSAVRSVPLDAFGLSLRGRAAFPTVTSQTTIPATRPTLTLNGSMDIDSLSRSTERDPNVPSTSSGHGRDRDFSHPWRLSNVPAASGSLRRDLGDGAMLSVAAHVNRPFGHVAGWEKVPPLVAVAHAAVFSQCQLVRRRQKVQVPLVLSGSISNTLSATPLHYSVGVSHTAMPATGLGTSWTAASLSHNTSLNGSLTASHTLSRRARRVLVRRADAVLQLPGQADTQAPHRGSEQAVRLNLLFLLLALLQAHHL